MICGVDEAGRGPLAGPVFAAAVILDPDAPITGLADSKTLSEKKLLLLRDAILAKAKAFAIASVEAQEIDRINILRASLLAMQKAVLGLSIRPQLVLVDGNRCPVLPMPARAIIKGDSLEPSISAASILAKTARDACLVQLHQRYPDYGFAQHKGYGTKAHLVALQKLGPCAEHRLSFAPIAKPAQAQLFV
jgi:ribonuclease HII